MRKPGIHAFSLWGLQGKVENGRCFEVGGRYQKIERGDIFVHIGNASWGEERNK